ncbi:Fe-S cluster assembly ATPase SufC [Candidatus Micrarchaeota archaeon]|nr:Fe-S cluster assembly ATPase SufC [Candidatus Micrarchaeota archaeon]
MFEVSNLTVSIEDKEILSGLNLSIKPGEVHAIMGPNGAGKSSLANALMGHPSLSVTGSIKLSSVELINYSVDERARAGLFLAFQNPEEIEGVRVSHFIRKALTERNGPLDMDQMVKNHSNLVENAEKLGMDKSFVSRQINVGFSGGERKRLEVLQIMALKPKLIMLDEIDSGMDVDGIKLITKVLTDLNDGKRGFLIITHQPKILKHIKPNMIHILANGKIVHSGDESLAIKIEEEGYSSFLAD